MLPGLGPEPTFGPVDINGLVTIAGLEAKDFPGLPLAVDFTGADLEDVSGLAEFVPVALPADTLSGDPLSTDPLSGALEAAGRPPVVLTADFAEGAVLAADLGGADFGDDLGADVLGRLALVGGLLIDLLDAGFAWDFVDAGFPCADFTDATGLCFPGLAGLVLAGLVLLLVATCEEVSF